MAKTVLRRLPLLLRYHYYNHDDYYGSAAQGFLPGREIPLENFPPEHRNVYWMCSVSCFRSSYPKWMRWPHTAHHYASYD